MGFWQNLLSGFRGGAAYMTPNVRYLNAGELQALVDPGSLTAVEMWNSQPHFRTVVSFIARNIAQLGVHSFIREGETDRRRDRDSALALSLQDVDGNMTSYELVFALVGDLLLYDRAYWLVVKNTDMPSNWLIRRLPPTWVEPVAKNAWEVDHYLVYMTSNGQPEKIPTDKILAFPGYHPGRMRGASPTVDALRETLREQVESAKYRRQVWKRGGRVSAVLERPAGARPWTDKAREAFREDWHAKFTGDGARAGGTPILEEGMQLRRIDFNAQEQQYVEAAKLSLQTVAAAFHVNPTMIGHNEGANYSNVREFRKMLYGDTLGPLVAQIEARINTFLIPRMGLDRRTYYVEFNIEEKLQGNFEEQAAALSSAVGLPWQTVNEARALRNLPALPGGDSLAMPLNYLIGGQTPSSAGEQNRNSAPNPVPVRYIEATTVKEPPPDNDVEQTRRILEKFFSRQGRVVRSRLGMKDAPTWWDYERWDKELAADLFSTMVPISVKTANSVLSDLGFSPEDYDVDRTLAFLESVAERIAGQINLTTRFAIEEALEDDEDVSGAVAKVFEEATTSRAEQSATTVTTTVAGFATLEAGKQTVGSNARKRWVVNSANPRASHAAMDGEEVPLNENFSNGMPWPGSIEGDVDEVAGCQCSLVIVT